MSKKIFNPKDWNDNIQKEELPFEPPNIRKDIPNDTDLETDIEKIVSEIEKRKLDITNNYPDWRNIGFALVDSFQESGREYFHRISKFHNEYTIDNCNHQYDNCLKSISSGITIGTFFYLAKTAGISSEKQKRTLPIIPTNVYDHLPDFLKKIISAGISSQEKDLLLLSSLTSISSCLTNISGIYHKKKVFSNLFLFITAPASAGKGRLTHHD